MNNNTIPELQYENTIYGNWNDHDYWVIPFIDNKKFVFHAPTLSISLLVNECVQKNIKSGQFPEILTEKLIKSLNGSVDMREKINNSFHLGVGLTTDCTLACHYCHADANRNNKADWQILKHAIDYAFNKGGSTDNKTLSVSFAVGGESTMAWELFVNVVETIREYELKAYCGVMKVYLSMTTNGYYGDYKRKYISENFNTITISIDGPPEIHDLHRPAKSGKPSYEIVSESCKYFSKNNNIKLGIRSTVSDLSVHKMADIVLHFAEQFGNNVTVTFEPLIKIGRAVNNKNLHTPDVMTFADNFWLAKEEGLKKGIRVINSGASIERIISRYCGAMSMPSFAVCVDGKITACHRDQDASDYGYGKIDSKSGIVTVDNNMIEKNKLLTALPEKCNKCFAKWHCAGDCPDLRRVGWDRCNSNRFLIYRELERLFRKKEEEVSYESSN